MIFRKIDGGTDLQLGECEHCGQEDPLFCATTEVLDQDNPDWDEVRDLDWDEIAFCTHCYKLMCSDGATNSWMRCNDSLFEKASEDVKDNHYGTLELYKD